MYNTLMNHCFELGFSTVINAELILGNLSTNCKGNGICKMLPLGASTNNSACRSIKCTIVKHEYDRISIVFDTEECCPKLYLRAFSSNNFLIEQAFSLPHWAVSALSLEEVNTISPGAYPITHLKNSAIISAKLYAKESME